MNRLQNRQNGLCLSITIIIIIIIMYQHVMAMLWWIKAVKFNTCFWQLFLCKY